MAVAMAACSLGLHLSADNTFRAFEKTTVFKGSSAADATKLCYITHKTRLSSSGITIIPRASTVTGTVEDGNQGETDTIPTPIVIIDQDSDPDATVVEIMDTANTEKKLHCTEKQRREKEKVNVFSVYLTEGI